MALPQPPTQPQYAPAAGVELSPYRALLDALSAVRAGGLRQLEAYIETLLYGNVDSRVVDAVAVFYAALERCETVQNALIEAMTSALGVNGRAAEVVARLMLRAVGEDGSRTYCRAPAGAEAQPAASGAASESSA